ncbi:MAG: COP23 domain-containing protein [Hormoscilla sp.]
MKYQLFAKMLAGLAIALTLGTANPEPSAAQSKKFFCGTSDGSPATMVRKNGENVPIIIWSNRNFEASGWTRERRCQEVSDRFQRYDNEGKLIASPLVPMGSC